MTRAVFLSHRQPTLDGQVTLCRWSRLGEQRPDLLEHLRHTLAGRRTDRIQLDPELCKLASVLLDILGIDRVDLVEDDHLRLVREVRSVLLELLVDHVEVLARTAVWPGRERRFD